MNYQLPILGVFLMALSIQGKSPPANYQAMSAVVSGYMGFGDRFNKVVAKRVSGNYVSSPLSVHVLLSMASHGADGITKTRLQKSLGLPADENISKSGFQTMMGLMNNVRDVELAVANKIYTAIGFAVKNAFKDVTRTYYYSESETVDFLKATESANKINNWVSMHTKNRIKDLVKSRDLDGDTAMVLVNAVYFRGEWAHPFSKYSTQPRPFHVNGITKKMVPMMYQEGSFNWGTINGVNAKYIELPYKNKMFSMFVILPNEINGLADVENNLHKIDLTQLKGKPSKVELSMPKFEVEKELDLKPILMKLKLRNIFENSADFRRISDSQPLKVSQIIQKAFIKVDEQGSEAAAATQMQVVATSLVVGGPPTPHFVVDRPFLCIIAVKSSKTIKIFNARIVDPS